jgi:hypothetical protein
MCLRPFGLALLACLASVPSLSAQDPESTFHRAYFLERERGQLQEALALYQQVAASPTASAALQGEAKEHAASLTEDLAGQDLAGLMPPEAILFAEVAQPGEALLGLLGQLGLLRQDGPVSSAKQPGAQQGFGLRPELVQALAGIRGLALALTRIPTDGGIPGGVLVLHAGDLEALRGLIEAGVLAQGVPEDPIEGMSAWEIEGRVHVALTRRLVVASSERGEIAGVLRRLAGKGEPSLASHGALQAELARRAGAPFFCALNAVPVRPMLRAMLAAQGAADPRARVLAAALDVESLRAFVARVAVGDDGLALEADLYLEQDHRNLVFNLLRGAPLDPVLLERIPEGAAAFSAGAFNERGPALAPLDQNADGAPVVTALDFGRELFANLAGYALFVVPGGAPIPSAALVLSSNDPARTGAVLGLLLGLGNVFAGGQALEGEAHEIAGAPTRVFRLPPGIPLYLTTHENTLLLSPSEELIEDALDGRSNGNSILHDEAFSHELGQLGKDTTFALCAHLGRTLAVLQPYLGSEQREQLARYAPLLTDTVVALQARHADAQLGLTIAVRGLPHIDGLVGAALERQRSHTAGVAHLESEPTVAHEGLAQRFERLAARSDGGAAARAFARQQLPLIADDARALNNFAWALLTEERFGQRFDDLALEYAKAANDASAKGVWQYVDTLALACFRTGAHKDAVALEEKALSLVEAAADRKDVEASLARYRKAAGALASDPR